MSAKNVTFKLVQDKGTREWLVVTLTNDEPDNTKTLRFPSREEALAAIEAAMIELPGVQHIEGGVDGPCPRCDDEGCSKCEHGHEPRRVPAYRPRPKMKVYPCQMGGSLMVHSISHSLEHMPGDELRIATVQGRIDSGWDVTVVTRPVNA